MQPLILMITGTPRKQAQMASRLQRQFARRGFKVRTAEAGLLKSEPLPANGCDILLIPCQSSNAEALTDQIEQRWNEQWVHWYSASRPTDSARRCKS